MFRRLFCSLLLLTLPVTGWAEDPIAYKDGAAVPTIAAITATAAAVQLVPSIRKGVTFFSRSSSTTVLLITRMQGDCAAITRPVGEPLYPGASVEATIADGWAGEFCGINETAGTVNLEMNPW